MSAVACPTCSRALPQSVVNGPPQAVLRCEGCSALLLWSNGKVVRTAKQGTPLGAPRPEASAAPPFAPALPARKTALGIPASTPRKAEPPRAAPANREED